MTEGPARFVYVFQGLLADTANAVFTTKESAERWIAFHQLTGILSEFELDRPPFDDWKTRQAERKRDGQRALMPQDPNQFVRCAHWHYFYGKGETDASFDQAHDDWVAEHRPGLNT